MVPQKSIRPKLWQALKAPAIHSPGFSLLVALNFSASYQKVTHI